MITMKLLRKYVIIICISCMLLLLSLAADECEETTTQLLTKETNVNRTNSTAGISLSVDVDDVFPVEFRNLYIREIETAAVLPDGYRREFREAIQVRFETNGRVGIVDSAAAADGVLHVSLSNFKNIPITYNDLNQQVPDRHYMSVKAYVRLRYYNAADNEWIRPGEEIKELVTYSLVTFPTESEHEALRRLAGLIGDAVFEYTMTGFYHRQSQHIEEVIQEITTQQLLENPELGMPGTESATNIDRRRDEESRTGIFNQNEYNNEDF